MIPSFAFVRPHTLEEAVNRLAAGGARLHGGGTDLLGCLRDGVFTADAVVSLSALDRLSGISVTRDGSVRIGALTTVSEVAADPRVADHYPAVLAEAAASVASPQLRNQGTIGGNLCQKPRCWYYRGDFHCLRKGGDMCYAFAGENQYHCIFGGDMCYIVHPSDTAPALAALGAVCRVTGPSGSRSVAVEKLHVPPSEDPTRETVLADDEILTEVVVPPAPPGLRSSYRKVRTRASWDFAVVGLALALAFDGDRIREASVFLSGVAPVPWRSRPLEEAVIGKTLNGATISAAAKAAVAGAEPLSKNGYKIPLLEGLVTEQLERLRQA